MSKKGRKTQGTLRLSYKNPNFLGDFIRFFQKMTEFIGFRRGFYQLICLYVAQRNAPARKIVINGAPLIDAIGHFIFEFFFVSAKKRIIY